MATDVIEKFDLLEKFNRFSTWYKQSLVNFGFELWLRASGPTHSYRWQRKSKRTKKETPEVRQFG